MKAINKDIEDDSGILIMGFCKVAGKLCVLPEITGLWTILHENIEIQDDEGNVLSPPESYPADFIDVDGKCNEGDKEFNQFIVSKTPKQTKKSKNKE